MPCGSSTSNTLSDMEATQKLPPTVSVIIRTFLLTVVVVSRLIKSLLVSQTGCELCLRACVVCSVDDGRTMCWRHMRTPSKHAKRSKTRTPPSQPSPSSITTTAPKEQVRKSIICAVILASFHHHLKHSTSGKNGRRSRPAGCDSIQARAA